MTLAPALLLALALVPLAWMMAGRARPPRGPRHRAMAARQWRRFGFPAIVLLAVIGRWDAFVATPPEFAPARTWFGIDGFDAVDRLTIAATAFVGIALGGVVMLTVTAWRASRGRADGTLFGDARPVLPRGRDELGWAAVVAIGAGVTEEAYFRLLLPLLATQAFGAPVAAFAASTLLFGAAHRYQGWRGVAATTFAGAALTALYLATQSLFVAMAVHAAGDLLHFVARPALRWRIERRRLSRAGIGD